jgi:helicase
MEIQSVTDIPAVDIALDTIKMGKQALVFCNTRQSSESTAEKIAESLETKDPVLQELSERILKVLSSPTKQCRRLAYCVKKGTAFHHAGLASEQRKIVENGFKKGTIKIICSTPTLAMGINLPAFRAVIKDLKRYGGRWGMEWIPALEYHQMAGRAGRPDFNDLHGEAICIAAAEKDIDDILDKFIEAEAEEIYSKLAVEPVLRTYCLSLLSTGFAKTTEELIGFFQKTFYGHQYGDMQRLGAIVDKILGLLEEWQMIIRNKGVVSSEFISASDIGKGSGRIEVTKLGERVAQLYLDPYTANQIVSALHRADEKKAIDFSYIQLACQTLELRPLPTVKVKETPFMESMVAEHSHHLIAFEPSIFEPEYDDFLKSIKLSLALYAWMDEKNEDEILEMYNIAPGELHAKKELCDWLLYAMTEIAEVIGKTDQNKTVKKARFRLDKGVKEELIPLTRIPNIGRVRARLLFRNSIKDIGDIKAADLTKLTQLLGPKIARTLKEETGEKIPDAVPDGKRKGQLGLGKYG